MSGYLDREPGIYEGNGSAMALVEQQRMNIIEQLRVSKAASVTLLEEDGSGRHWGVFIQEDGDAESFLVYAATKAIRDAAAALGVDHPSCCRLVLAAIAEGVGR